MMMVVGRSKWGHGDWGGVSGDMVVGGSSVSHREEWKCIFIVPNQQGRRGLVAGLLFVWLVITAII